MFAAAMLHSLTDTNTNVKANTCILICTDYSDDLDEYKVLDECSYIRG